MNTFYTRWFCVVCTLVVLLSGCSPFSGAPAPSSPTARLTIVSQQASPAARLTIVS